MIVEGKIMIVSVTGRVICPICYSARMITQYAHLTPDTLDAVCKHCRKAERAGKRLPRNLRAFADLNSNPVIGPTARARMQQNQAHQAYQASRRPLPPGITSARAGAIARWLNEQGAPVKMTCRDIWFALRGAESVRAVWPACPL